MESNSPPAPLVSVIIPAYNAASTLDETLRSVRAQTHDRLEIIVVDDGSTDSTVAIAEEHARRDDRVRLVAQPNGGVARARNTGLASARGDLVAPIDADDVWAPEKIALQVQALASNPRALLCYTWFACLDPAGKVTGFGARHVADGNALAAMCRTNLVGNGSGALMRRDAVMAAGGYDPGLKAHGAQGCEDYKLYLALAAAGEVTVVPQFLTGYRISPHNMSSDAAQMCRSHLLVLDEFAATHPERKDDLKAGRHAFAQWLVLRAIRDLRILKIASLLLALAREDRVAALALVRHAPPFVLKRAVAKIGRVIAGERRAEGVARTFPVAATDG